MPITLTLSDAAALEIMKQMTTQMIERHTPKKESLPDDNHAHGICQTLEKVSAMKTGEMLHVSSFALRINCPSGVVSNMMQKLRDRGVVEMVQRGTWRKTGEASQHPDLKLAVG